MTTAKPKRGAAKKGGIATAAVLLIATPLVIKWEGVKTEAYIDPVGIPTVCIGQTGPHIRMGQRFSEQECFAMLDAELRAKAAQLDRCVSAPLAPHEAAAVLDLAYNVGVSAVCRSTMVRQINAGAPASTWCRQLDRWVIAGGRRWNGLINRRADARAICEGSA
jgi:lysozyme